MMLFHNQPSHACALYLVFLDESFHPIEENHKFYYSQYSMSIMNLSYVLYVNLSYSKYPRIKSPSRRKKGMRERNKGDKNNKYFCHRGTGEGTKIETDADKTKVVRALPCDVELRSGGTADKPWGGKDRKHCRLAAPGEGRLPWGPDSLRLV